MQRKPPLQTDLRHKGASMSNVNRIILIGNLGREPELRHTPKGNAYCNLSVATHKPNSNKETGLKRRDTHWHRATVWGKQAENCAKYLTKGSRIYLEGELQMKDWKDKAGNARRSAEISVESVQFLGDFKSKASPEKEEELACGMVQ
jgi:single-strand DNA-binding protein